MKEPWEFAADRDREQEEWLQSRPVCDCCEERIQDESCTKIMGLILCDRCIEEHKKFID